MISRRSWVACLVCVAIGLCVVACNGNGNTNGNGPTPPKPGQGYALAIGLNSVNPAHYGGWNGALTGCEPDAKDMKKIADDMGFTTDMLLTAAATRAAVKAKLNGYATTLKSGDLLVVSYSGHGGNLPDINGDEADGIDETWVLYDGEMIDDELAQQWAKFKKGVRILVFSDSCHSGTVLKHKKSDFENPTPERMEKIKADWEKSSKPAMTNVDEILANPRMSTVRGPDAPDPIQVRAMPFEIALATYEKNKKTYDDIAMAVPKDVKAGIVASLILISGCEDHQYSMDVGFNGLFTWKLVETWNAGAFTGDHPAFHVAIRTKVSADTPSQTPKYTTAGVPMPTFQKQKPYTK